MTIEHKDIADTVLRLSDSIIKLSAALIVVPITFLKVVSETELNAHPNALQGFQTVGNGLKAGIFLPLGLAVLLGLATHYFVTRALCSETLVVNGKLSFGVRCFMGLTVVAFGIGTVFLAYLFFQFPLEIRGPFIIGKSQIG